MEKNCLNIILIEDSERHAKGIENAYRKAVEVMQHANVLKKDLGLDDVCIEWIEGKKTEVMRNNDKFSFYDDTIYADIQAKITNNQKENICTGILLDVSLSKEEYEKASINDYSGFIMARKIYEEFDSCTGIYIVTSIREFSSQVLRLMGTRELAKRYISKDLVTEYQSYGAIARTIYYMFKKENLNEKMEDGIDQLSGQY